MIKSDLDLTIPWEKNDDGDGNCEIRIKEEKCMDKFGEKEIKRDRYVFGSVNKESLDKSKDIVHNGVFRNVVNEVSTKSDQNDVTPRQRRNTRRNMIGIITTH
nr:hypothetical protein [Tanacetum cinerariifolium]